MFDNEVADSPREWGSHVAYSLCGKVNEWIRTLDQKTNQVTSTAGQPIKTLQFMEHSAILLEFDSKALTNCFQLYCKDKNLLTCICSTVKIQTRTCQVVMKFVPCDGSFLPEDKSQMRVLETEHNLEVGSIVAASWIKKPKCRTPNQKTVNVKVFCSSPITANRLLTEWIFIANSRVVVIKDTWEPICCNKCQEYSHIHKQCENVERCATCTRTHPTSECNYPNDSHCISCSTSSKHTSSKECNCPQFLKHASDIDVCLPENTMLYFPVLSQPNTFILAAKNMHAFTPNYPNRPRTYPPNPQQQCQPPPPLPPASSWPSLFQNFMQTTIGQNSQFTSPANTGPPRTDGRFSTTVVDPHTQTPTASHSHNPKHSINMALSLIPPPSSNQLANPLTSMITLPIKAGHE